MKKIVLFLMISIIFSSCAEMYEMNKIVIKDYNYQMRLLRINFPEMYEQYKNGIIIIDEIYTYTDKKTGEEKVRVKYHHVTSTTTNYYYRRY